MLESINLSVVVCGCETWFVTLGQEKGAEKNVWAEERGGKKRMRYMICTLC